VPGWKTARTGRDWFARPRQIGYHHQPVQLSLRASGFPMFDKDMRIAGYDDELSKAIEGERRRQEEHIELIASENYASPRVLEAQGSVLTNKYAEGYPGKRYYGGCEFVDVAEQLAIDRVKQLFNADYANVQPHSGSQANAAVYLALLKPGDTILGMSLADGGHLTHGSKVNFSGKLFNAVQYGLNNETTTRSRRWRRNTGRKWWWPASPPIRCRSTGSAFALSPTASVPTCSWTWRMSPGWWPPGCIQVP
jgi:hypothetical protein